MASTDSIVMAFYGAIVAWTYVLLAILLVVKLLQLVLSFSSGKDESALEEPKSSKPDPNTEPKPEKNQSPKPAPESKPSREPTPEPSSEPSPLPTLPKKQEWYPEITKIDISNNRAHGIVRVRRP
jgi:hypothetical protein